jgi:hypothetical protein
MGFPVADTARQTGRDNTFFFGSVLISQSSHVCGRDFFVFFIFFVFLIFFYMYVVL